MARLIYKILTRAAADQLHADGTLQPYGVDAADGYVHFSTGAQLHETLDKHYAEHDELVLLAVSTATCGAALRWEPSRNNEAFPHLYAPLSAAMVSESFLLNSARDGLPAWLEGHGA